MLQIVTDYSATRFRMISDKISIYRLATMRSGSKLGSETTWLLSLLVKDRDIA